MIWFISSSWCLSVLRKAEKTGTQHSCLKLKKMSGLWRVLSKASTIIFPLRLDHWAKIWGENGKSGKWYLFSTFSVLTFIDRHRTIPNLADSISVLFYRLVSEYADYFTWINRENQGNVSDWFLFIFKLIIRLDAQVRNDAAMSVNKNET